MLARLPLSPVVQRRSSAPSAARPPLRPARVLSRQALQAAGRRTLLACAASAGKELVVDEEKSITKARARQRGSIGQALTRDQVSFGTIGLGVGLTLLSAGFLGYFGFVGGRGVGARRCGPGVPVPLLSSCAADNSLSALLLIYGFPISLIGESWPARVVCTHSPPTRRQALR